MTVAAKPNGSLKKFLNTKRVETRLIGPVERDLLTRPRDSSRRTDVLHPSDLVKKDFCKRAGYFVMTQGPKKDDRPSLQLQSIFDEGHAIHHKWQRYVRQGGWLYGKWTCGYCGHNFWDQSPDKCPECSSDSYLDYSEVPLRDEELIIEGHADGWVKGLGEDFLIEIKSVGMGTIRMEEPSLLAGSDLGAAWKNVRRPFSTHIRQGQLYLELTKRMHAAGLLESYPKEIVFIYELKMDQSYKEFVMQADSEYVEVCMREAEEISQAVRAGGPAPLCSHDPEQGCKHCKVYDKAPA